jgi:hypothetical protein
MYWIMGSRMPAPPPRSPLSPFHHPYQRGKSEPGQQHGERDDHQCPVPTPPHARDRSDGGEHWWAQHAERYWTTSRHIVFVAVVDVGGTPRIQAAELRGHHADAGRHQDAQDCHHARGYERAAAGLDGSPDSDMP